MHFALIAVQVTGIGFGLAAALLWWVSARSGFQVASSLENSRSEDGDLAFQIGGKFMIYNITRPARLSAWAAFCTGFSTLCQAATLWLQSSN
jgi:hypothetical protein